MFLEPVFKSMIWGGDRLRTEFGYTIPDNRTGECWAISAHPKGDCRIKDGSYKGRSLSWLWDNHRELFGNMEGKTFPLLVKIIDAKADLSIQVHPDDSYAKEKEKGAGGKTECWYILDCKENATIVIGHDAKNKAELRSMIEDNRWKDLIREIPIKKGDFFQIEPGTVHAIKEGTMLLETQQNSDITYRLYDYGRLDNGKPRQLHLAQSLDVIRCPHRDAPAGGQTIKLEACEILELITCRYYTVEKINLHGEQSFVHDKCFMNISVLNGQGQIDGTSINKGDHFILPAGYGKYSLKGTMELMVSYL